MSRIGARGPTGRGLLPRGARRWSRWLAATMAISALWVVAAAPVVGQSGSSRLAPALELSTPPGGPLGAVPSDPLGTAPPAGSGPVTVFLELTETPAVDVFEARRDAGRSADAAAEAARDAREVVDQVADRVLAALRERDPATREVFRTTNAVAGLAVIIDASRVRDLAAAAEIRSVRPVVPKRTTNSGAAQLTETLHAWQRTGRFGDGVRIGIVDDGVDYTHAVFGGPGTPEAYDAVDPTEVDPSSFPTAKVAGGMDFAGDEYDASGASGPEAEIPDPDPNPLPCGNHGTHVAGTAAGFGVTADGGTFRGDYRHLDADAADTMRIGPGVAPRATLYALKIFGCGGSTALIPPALDWALDPNGDGDFSDRLDIVNMSLGADYGAPDDPDNLFVRTLAHHGVLSVVSAGNGGDIYDIGGSPGSSPEALTVGSTRDAQVLRDGAEVTAPADVAGLTGGQYSVLYTDYDRLDQDAPVVALSDPDNLDGCDPYTDADAAAVAGRHVWLEWDDQDATRRCGSTPRADHALASGATGVLLTSALEHFVAGIAGNAEVPMFQFTGRDTAVLRPALEAGTLRVRLSGQLRESVRTADPDIVDTVSTFTSRGVRAPAVKPDVAAPGDTIASALTGSGTGLTVSSGTSMSAPHVSGIAALVRESRPDYSVAEVKAAIMNTAGADVHSGRSGQGPVHGPTRIGAGRVNATAALSTPVLALVGDVEKETPVLDGANGAHQGSVSFGVIEADASLTRTATIRLLNKSDRPARYRVDYHPITSVPGVTYGLSADTVDIAPAGTAELTLTLRIDDPSALRKIADPTIEKTQLGVARQFLAESTGRVVLTAASRAASADAAALRVPVHAAAKPVAAVTVPEAVRFEDGDQRAELVLGGRGLDQGSGDAAYRSLVSVLHLQARSGRLPECGVVLTVDCAPNETARAGDVRYVGVASTAPLAVQRGRPADAVLAFGITTWGDWYNLGGNTVPFVEIDTTGDGDADFEVFVTKPDGSDVLVATTVDLSSEEEPVVGTLPVNGQFGDVDTGVFDSNVVVLPVSLAALGIDPTAETAPIRYTAGVAGYYTGPDDTGQVIDSVGPSRFDPLRPPLWVQGGDSPAGAAAVSYLSRPGDAVVVHRDTSPTPGIGGWGLGEPGGGTVKDRQLLVLHPHNASGHRVTLVRVREPGVLPIAVP